MELRTQPLRSDRVHIADCGSILIATASGLLGLAECLQVMARVRETLADSPARAVLIDLRAAALTIGPPEYVTVVKVALERPVRKPIAFVVGPGLIRFGDAHRVLMARRGLARRLFPSIAPALRWLGRPELRAPGPDLLS